MDRGAWQATVNGVKKESDTTERVTLSHFVREFKRAVPVLAASSVVKNPPGNAGDTWEAGSIPGSERSSGGGHGNPLQYSCL